MFALFFEQLQADIQNRKVLEHYPCIGITDNVRCTSILSNQESLESLKKILSLPGEEVSVESMRRAGQLSLCARHSRAQGSECCFDEAWLFGTAMNSTTHHPPMPGQRSPGPSNKAAPSSRPSTPQCSRLLFPESSSKRPSHLRELGTVSESAVGSHVDNPLVIVTPSDQRMQHPRSMSVSETPTRSSKNGKSESRQQPDAKNNDALFPQSISASAEKRPYPCFFTIRDNFRNRAPVDNHQCIGKAGRGTCQQVIKDGGIVEDLRIIFAKPVEALGPEDMRGVIWSLLCPKHFENQRKTIEAQWRTALPDFPEDSRSPQLTGSTPSKRRSSTVSRQPSESNSTSRQSSEHRLPRPESGDNDALIAADADITSSGRTDSHIPNLEVIETELVSGSPSVEDIPQDTPSADERVDTGHWQGPPVTSVKRNLFRPQTKPRRTSSANTSDEIKSVHNPFVKGERSNWAPHRIRNEVAMLFLASLPIRKSSGSLYLLKAKCSGHVKIGYTLGDWKKRRTDIQSKSDVALDENTTHIIEGIPFAVLLRLEKLVHADLAYFQRDLPISRTRTQHEWFEIDFAKAQQTARFWYDKMKMPHAFLDQSIYVASSEEEDRANWADLHQDRTQRIEDWRKSIRHPTVFQNLWVTVCGSGKVWLTGFIAVFLGAMLDRSRTMDGAWLLVILWTVHLVSVSPSLEGYLLPQGRARA